MANELPMKVREDIQPFLFWCQNCDQYIFHNVCEQPHGFSVGLLFRKTPLWTSQTAYQVVCVKCDMVGGQLQSDDVKKLATNLLPKSIYRAYPAIHGFYSPGYYEAHRSELVGEPPDAGLAALVDKWMGTYRLEV